MPDTPFVQAVKLMADLDAKPLAAEQQAKCHHEMWLCYIPDGEAKCRKCGFSRPITDEEWEDF